MSTDDGYKSTLEDYGNSMIGIDPVAIFARTIRPDGADGDYFVWKIQLDGPDIVQVGMYRVLDLPLIAATDPDIQQEKAESLAITARLINNDQSGGRLVIDGSDEAGFIIKDSSVLSPLTEDERRKLGRFPLGQAVKTFTKSQQEKSDMQMPCGWSIVSFSQDGYEIDVFAASIKDDVVNVSAMDAILLIKPPSPTKPSRNPQFNVSGSAKDVS
jgi:hypothetical protein